MTRQGDINVAIRELRLYGDEILTKTCRPVSDVNAHVQLLLDDMTDTLKATPNCTVLAANQLGIMRRLVVLKMDSDTNGVSAVIKFVNPVIIEQTGEQDCLESCISVKNISGMTIRPKNNRRSPRRTRRPHNTDRRRRNRPTFKPWD